MFLLFHEIQANLWWIPCLFTYVPLVPCGFSRHLVAVFGPAFQVAPLRARRNDLGDLGEVSSSQDGFLVEGYPPVN